MGYYTSTISYCTLPPTHQVSNDRGEYGHTQGRGTDNDPGHGGRGTLLEGLHKGQDRIFLLSSPFSSKSWSLKGRGDKDKSNLGLLVKFFFPFNSHLAKMAALPGEKSSTK